MIYILGVKRVLLIVALVVFCMAGAAYRYVILAPQYDAVERESSINEGEVSTQRGKINDLLTNHQRFLEQKEDYDMLEKMDFFNTQNRLEARTLFGVLRDKSGVISVRADMKPSEVEFNQHAREINHKLLKTEMSFDVGAYEDIEIYNFLFLLDYAFPGVIEIEEFEISKTQPVTQPLLRKIGGGEDVPIVDAKIKAVWWTLVPSDAVEVEATVIGEFD
ncbi:MAG: hypothetical protein HRT94_02415 [Alphaproteobacteria bacterium]|nr:hypothetical protein [Alphaproteobacteria bacterium]